MQTAPKKELTLFDSTCLIMGIIIGVGIYQLTPTITGGAYCWWGAMLLWVAGGAISLCGALGYAELATAYPREGGDYVYLTRAYGGWAGFMFGWVQLAVVRPGDIAVPAFAFAMYARKIYDPLAGTIYDPLAGATTFPYMQAIYACAAAIVLTLINVIGVREGKWTQNLLVLVKVLGLLAIVGVAVSPTLVGAIPDVQSPDLSPLPDAKPSEFSFSGLSLALILVLFTFGGWNEMAYVAAEVRNPKRNIVRALVLGTVAVTVIYLLVNAAFFHALGYAGTAGSDAVAADTVNAVVSEVGPTVFPGVDFDQMKYVGGALISALICISALGAVNGLVFTGARISYAVGTEHRVFGFLGRWNDRTGTPVRALLVQGAIAVALIILLGSFVDAIIYTACVVYSFYLATTLAVIVLRRKEPQVERPYRVTGYPIPTIFFSAVCAYLIYRAVIYKPEISCISLGIMFAGLTIHSPAKWVLTWGAWLMLLVLWPLITSPLPISPDSVLYGTVLDAVYPGHVAASGGAIELLWALAGILCLGLCVAWYRFSLACPKGNLPARIGSGVLLALGSLQPFMAVCQLARADAAPAVSPTERLVSVISASATATVSIGLMIGFLGLAYLIQSRANAAAE